jgi:hypothetical protein
MATSGEELIVSGPMGSLTLTKNRGGFAERLLFALAEAFIADRIGAERREREAGAWRTLMEAAGSWQDGSATSVSLWQDDATCTCGIRTGFGQSKKDFYVERGGFQAAINQLSNYLADG